MLNKSEIIFIVGKASKRRQSLSSGEPARPVRHGLPDGPEVHSDGDLQLQYIAKKPALSVPKGSQN